MQNQWLALIKIPDIKNDAELEEPSHDYLTMLFDRISSNGTRLSPDDLLFSMVKQSWPEAHNLVYEIQKEIGSLMKPTDFVMTAYRLASLRGKEAMADDPQPNAKSFHKNLGKLLGNESQPGEMFKLIRDGSLVRAYSALKEIIVLKDEDDYGMPEAIFPYLDVPLLQVILYWILMRDSSNAVSESERKDIIRFVLYWLVCHKGATSRYAASKKAIAIINNNQMLTFMGIYKQLSIEEKEGVSSIFCRLDIPDSSIESKIKIDHFRDPNKRAEDFFGKNEQLYHHFTSRKALLIWFQRKWMHKECKSGEFKEFKPLAGQDEDNVPYDFDHLVPQSNWSSFQGGSKPELDQNTRKFRDLWPRRSLGNSIGNYRVMSASDNRSRGDAYLGAISLKNEEIWGDYAFHPNDDEIEQWNKASPEKNPWYWDNERVLAFQYAVESRVQYLYKRYYDEACFKSWLEDESEKTVLEL
ncbi:hypothetical protein [Methylobacter tundripaludum]|uniref:hypothetical protein n=1 Tax=Methylobacter tundripaludum TaxID=173365 RepID=UPI0004826BED|nr:hypothetical protein [Methylobacter tundripaludum]